MTIGLFEFLKEFGFIIFTSKTQLFIDRIYRVAEEDHRLLDNLKVLYYPFLILFIT